MAAAHAYELNSDNWDELTDGKTVFVKYFTTWCQHCKDIAPDWEKLENKYRDSEHVLVGHVQCNGAAHTLCERDGVNSYPEIKHGAHETLYSYTDTYNFEAWDAVVSNLTKPCDVLTLQYCSEREKEDIERIMAMDDKQIVDFLESFQLKVHEIEVKRAKVVEKATRMYEEAQDEYDREFENLQLHYPYEIMNAVAKKKKELKKIFKEAVEIEMEKLNDASL